MFERLSAARRRRERGQGGFTLIELLVVIVILGILAGVVVFAVSGINDKGEDSAIAIDSRTLATAEEAFCARNGRYAEMSELVSAGLLQGESTYNEIRLTSVGTCTSAGAYDKAGYVVGLREANGGQAVPSTVRIPATPATGSGFPQPVNMNKGPAFTVNSYMMDSLLWRDGTGNTIPWLAQSYTHPTPTTWVFTLRNGVTWHDGTAFDAGDVAFTFGYLKSGGGAATQGLFKPNLADIVSVQADTPAAGQVTFTLTSENNAFVPFVASTMPIMPEHVWSTVTTGAASKNDPAAYVGTGPFKYTGTGAWPSNGVVNLVRNEDFYLGAPKVQNLSMVAVASGQEATLLTNGSVDVTGPSSPTNANLNAFGSFPSVNRAGGSYSAIHFNLQKNFPFGPTGAPSPGADVKFRQAVAYALDRSTLISSLVNGNGMEASLGGLGPNHPMLAGGLPTYSHSLAQANALLDSIGVLDGADGDSTREWPPGTNLDIQLKERPGASYPATNLVLPMLNAVGLGVTHSPWPDVPTHDSDLRAGNYDMAIVGYGNLAGDPDWLRTRFDGNTAPTSNFFNVLGFDDAAFHAAATAQLTATTVAARRAEVVKMQEIIAQNALVIPLYLADIYTFYRPTFSAWYYTPPGDLPTGPPSVYNKQVFVTARQW